MWAHRRCSPADDPGAGPTRGAPDAYAVATLARVSGDMPAGSPPAQGGYLSTTAEAAKTAIDRLTFFSDAVVAIAMTLLALELPVPQADSAGALLDFLGDHYGEFLAFFISFFVIAQYWRGHHRLYRYVTDAPPRLVMLNILWLLTVILTPYATRNLYGGQDVSHSDFPWRFAFYAVVQACAAISFILAEREIQKQGLFAPETPRALLERVYTVNLALVLTFLVSIPVAFVLYAWAFAIWSLIPLWIALAWMVQHRLSARTGSGT